MSIEVEFVKPKKGKDRRRSSFFRRSLSSAYSDSPTYSCTRATLPASQCNGFDPEEDEKANQYNVTGIQEDKTTEYIKKLKKEKEDWNDLFKRKSKEEEMLRDRRLQVASSTDFLTAEDMKFLDDQPDYVVLGRLLDAVTEDVLIKQRRIDSTIKKVKSLIGHCEKITDEQAGDVIDYFMREFDEFHVVAPVN